MPFTWILRCLSRHRVFPKSASVELNLTHDRDHSARGRAMLLVALFAILLAFVPGSGFAQGPFISPACRENCALTDAACIVREQTCQTKLSLYSAYMAQLGAGVTLHRLPQLYVELLQPHYTGNLGNVRFGYADRQPATATTDCSTIYFGSFATQQYVNDLKDGQLDTTAEFRLLLHELRHVSQCVGGGGRDQYAKRWFRDLDISLLQQRSIDPKQLHDLMPMEGDASSAADRILEEIKVIRDQNGKLVRPLSVKLFRENAVLGTGITVWVGTPHKFTAGVSGGSGPFKFSWSVKAPNQTRAQPATGAEDEKLEWTPNRLGTYEVGIFVTQPETDLKPVFKTIQVKVNTNPLTVAAIPENNRSPVSNVQLNLQLRMLTVEVRRSLADVASAANVCVTDRANQQVYGRKRVAGSTASFTVPTGRTVDITVSAIRFVGVSQTLTMPNADHSVTITINRGAGGPVCSLQ